MPLASRGMPYARSSLLTASSLSSFCSRRYRCGSFSETYARRSRGTTYLGLRGRPKKPTGPMSRRPSGCSSRIRMWKSLYTVTLITSPSKSEREGNYQHRHVAEAAKEGSGPIRVPATSLLPLVLPELLQDHRRGRTSGSTLRAHRKGAGIGANLGAAHADADQEEDKRRGSHPK